YLIMMDIDDFKKVNDTYGHDIGDLVLKELSKMLLNIAKKRKIDVGRWGGEEFMATVYFDSKDTKDSKEKVLGIAEEIRKSFEEIEFIEVGHKTVSVGVSCDKDSLNPDAVCTKADQALYKAKQTGKNKVVYMD
nr:GGDEF domain-containing protein [Lachnospiraceae bacterium]